MARSKGDGHARQMHSWASFTPAGVDDAERGHPAVSLEAFAAARGLDYLNSVRSGRLIAVVPPWKERVFNACNGSVAPHLYGLVAHELLQVGWVPSESGGYVNGLRGDFFGARLRDPWLGVMDVVTGGVSDMFTDDGTGPFPRYQAAVPTTSVALHVPEAALVPRFGVGIAYRMPKHHEDTEAWGLPGFRLRSQLDDKQKRTILGGPVGPELAALASRSYADLRVVNSQVRVTVDGFVTDVPELDWLIGRTVAIADALARTEAPLLTPAPFDVPLPEASAPVRVAPKTKLKLGPIRIGFGKPPQPRPGRPTRTAGARCSPPQQRISACASRTRRRFTAPSRGCRSRAPRGVLQGRFPGGFDGRLTVHLHDLLESNGRVAVTFPAPAGTPDTPPAGVSHDPTDMRVTVSDGLVSCWSRTLQRATIAPEGTSRRALEAARALGYPPGN